MPAGDRRASEQRRPSQVGAVHRYVRPDGAAHMSAGPDEVRRPRIPIRFASWLMSHKVVFGLRWRPCRSSRFNALAKLQTVICATAPWICLQEGRRSFAFANISARKISPVPIIAQIPGELVGQRHRDEASRFFRQKRADPVGERAFALAHATQQ
jgi:hypothetical protein